MDPDAAFFSLPLLCAAPFLGISVLPASPWFFSLLLCISLGFAIDFLFACVAIELRGISWPARMIRTAIVALFSGTVLPFRLLPFGLARVFELQPFGSLGGAPLALFVGTAAERILLAQVFWNLTLWPAAILWFCRSREAGELWWIGENIPQTIFIAVCAVCQNGFCLAAAGPSVCVPCNPVGRDI